MALLHASTQHSAPAESRAAVPSPKFRRKTVFSTPDLISLEKQLAGEKPQIFPKISAPVPDFHLDIRTFLPYKMSNYD